MKIELFTLCDYATNESGKLTIVNTRDIIEVRKLPWRTYIGFAIKGIIMHRQPKGTRLTLSIFKKDKPEAKLFETASDVPGETGRFVAAGNLRGLIFSEEGLHTFRISTGNGLCEDYDFNITIADDNTVATNQSAEK